MNFVSALAAGSTPQEAAKNYISELLTTISRNETTNDIDLTVSSYKFIQECFESMNMTFNISLEDFKRTLIQPYAESNSIYVFEPIPSMEKLLQEFFEELPRQFLHSPPINGDHDENIPLDRYLCILINLCTVMQYVCFPDVVPTPERVSYFREPIARLSFFILSGLVKMETEYTGQIMLFRNVCTSLSITARFNVLYRESNSLTLSPMLNIFFKHYQIFCDENHSAIKYITLLLSREITEKISSAMAFEFLQQLIHKLEKLPKPKEGEVNYLRILTNELISDDFKAFIFAILIDMKPIDLIIAVLNFLNSLIRNLVSVECFQESFIEQIFFIIMHYAKSSRIAEIGFELYIGLATRQYDNIHIVYMILESFYKANYKNFNSTNYNTFSDTLKVILNNLKTLFPACIDFQYYRTICISAHAITPIRYCAVIAMKILIRMHSAQYKQSEAARKQIHQLVKHLPNMITQSSDTAIRQFITSIFIAIDFKMMIRAGTRGINPLVERIATFCRQSFLDDNIGDDGEMRCYYVGLSGAWNALEKLHYFNEVAIKIYDDIIPVHDAVLDAINAESFELEQHPELFKKYDLYLCRLKILLDYDLIPQNLTPFLYQLMTRDVNRITEKVKTLNYIIYPTVALIVVKYYNLNPNEALDYAIAFKLNCVNALGALEALHDDEWECNVMEGFLSAIIALQLNLQELPPIANITIDQMIMHLIRTLNKSTHNKLLYAYLNNLIRSKRYEGSLAILWKLLCHYNRGRMEICHSDAIGNIIVTLLQYNPADYLIILTNINVQFSKTGMSKCELNGRMKSQMKLLNQHACLKDAWMLKWQSVLMILYHIAIAIKHQTMKAHVDLTENRLAALRIAPFYLQNLLLDHKQFQPIICWMNDMNCQQLRTVEAETLEAFKTLIRAKLELSKSQNNSGQYFEPEGPLNYWQLGSSHDF